MEDFTNLLNLENSNKSKILINNGRPGEVKFAPNDYIATYSPVQVLLEAIKKKHTDLSFENIYEAIAKVRMIKSENEVKFLKQAANITVKGINEAAKAIKPGIDERYLEGVLEGDFKKNGSQRLAFGSIIKSGPNSHWPWRILATHYNRRNRIMQNGDLVRVLPDATFGLNVSGDKWYIGVAIPQLLGSELRFMDEAQSGSNDLPLTGKLATHIYMLGAYNFDITSIFSCEPSILFKSTPGATNVDFGVKFGYKELLWTGINSKQNNDLSSLAALIGFNLNDRYSLGYSFGISNSDAGTQSHEFMLGLRFPSR